MAYIMVAIGLVAGVSSIMLSGALEGAEASRAMKAKSLVVSQANKISQDIRYCVGMTAETEEQNVEFVLPGAAVATGTPPNFTGYPTVAQDATRAEEIVVLGGADASVAAAPITDVFCPGFVRNGNRLPLYGNRFQLPPLITDMQTYPDMAEFDPDIRATNWTYVRSFWMVTIAVKLDDDLPNNHPLVEEFRNLRKNIHEDKPNSVFQCFSGVGTRKMLVFVVEEFATGAWVQHCQYHSAI